MRTFRSGLWLFALAGLAYLPLMGQMGYFNDDWYLMWAAKAGGMEAFHPIYAIDRPLRAYVLGAAYTLFGENPLGYNLSGWLFRVASALAFGWVVKKMWQQEGQALTAAAFYLLYPGFLWQYNGIDYQSQLFSLAAAMFSVALSLKAWQETAPLPKFWQTAGAILLGWLYLGLVEYEIGFEALRLALLLVLALRAGEIKTSLTSLWKGWSVYLLIPAGYLAWRALLFEGGRKATDMGAQLAQFWASPAPTALEWGFKTLQNTFTVLFSAWVTPLQQRVGEMQPWVYGMALMGIVLFRLGSRKQLSNLPRRAFWESVGVGIAVCVLALVPIVMVNRWVEFPDFSRYALVSSAGAALLFAGIGLQIPQKNLRAIVLGILIGWAFFTQGTNADYFARVSQVQRQFWWQVAWRAPQLETNTTLVALYPAGNIQEDYFVWGPANLLYHPHSQNAEYLQPGIYAAIAGEDTLQKAQARERQVYDLRRSIRTYANYRNLLILSQPDKDSCMQALDSNLPEIAATAPDFVRDIAPYSEIEHIQTNAPALTPPFYPFGAEPAHTWCYYYQKISLARQKGDWQEAHRLSAETLELGYTPKVEMEWLPLLHSLAQAEDWTRLEQVSVKIGHNLPPAERLRLANLPLPPADLQSLQSIFCAAPP
jgi:hypothetical protein